MKNIIIYVLILSFLVSCGQQMSENKAAFADENMKEDVGSAEEQEPEKTKKSKTWKRTQKTVNKATLFIGDKEQLELKGTQIAVKVDGFRARVLIDYYFYNDRDWQLEGTFKLRLPTGASPYFLAFGQTVYLDSNNQQSPRFTNYQTMDSVKFSSKQIMQMRDSSWTSPKQARVVPKEKAAFAYSQTVRRQIDPALMEWAGADVFNCRVFPLQAKKLHRIVIGYDVNLTNLDKDKIFNLSIPETKSPTIVDLNISNIKGSNIETEPKLDLKKAKNKKIIHIENPEVQNISIRYTNTKNILITSDKNTKEEYFAAIFKANLPNSKSLKLPQNAVLMLDVSLSSNPDKFNIWLQMAKAILKNNKNTIKKFSVLFFNIESFWWKNEFVENTDNNIEEFLKFANNLSLEGATDLAFALDKATNSKWTNSVSKNIFLLSDGASTWGEDDIHTFLKKNKDRIFAYNTGMSGTSSSTLEYLTRKTGGAIFSLVSEDEIKIASTAFNTAAWKINSIKFDNGTDILIAGRPNYIYNGQNILFAGRGIPQKAKLTLNISNGDENKTIVTNFKQIIKTNLAKRTYGQIATNQLEEFDYLTEKYSVSYASYFQIPGKTCSLLMLETEEDYKQYNIRKNEDLFVIKSNNVNSIISNVLKNIGNLLGNAKATFMNWLKKLTTTEGLDFKMHVSLETILEKTPKSSFIVKSKGLYCKQKTQDGISNKIIEELKKSKIDYDIITEESMRRKKEFGNNDALKFLSSLIEKNPGNGVMARDVAFSAIEWDLYEQAYFLFKRVIKSRPYEPQTYHAIAQSLIKMNKIDLAVIYFEIAISTKWDSRFGDFQAIIGIDYLRLLAQITNNKYTTSFPDYIKSRYESLSKEFNIASADLIITIMWNTDNTDIDLHVIEPNGEECFYKNPKTKIGGNLTKDVTQGYGPEMYILKKAVSGKYVIKAKYYSSNRNRASTRTKVYATIYRNWGKKEEKVINKVVSLEDKKDIHKILNFEIKQ